MIDAYALDLVVAFGPPRSGEELPDYAARFVAFMNRAWFHMSLSPERLPS